MTGFFNPHEIEPGDLVHVAPPTGQGGITAAFCLVVVRQLTPVEVTLFVGDTTPPVGDTWFWIYDNQNPVWGELTPDLTTQVSVIAASSVTALIKAQADRDAIAALVPVRTAP